MRRLPSLVIALALAGGLASASGAAAVSSTTAGGENRILTHRQQAVLIRGFIEKRFDTLLPRLMREAGIDMWVIVSREYNDDPVFRSMAPLTTYSSRRRTILVFVLEAGGQVSRHSIGRFDYDGLFKVVPTANDGQWEGLRKLVAERNPKVIGINTSETFNHADGITANEKDNLMKALGPEFAPRVTSAEKLAVNWLDVKLPEEADLYRHVMRVAHQIIREAFSNEVIVPGVTTTEDVVWWMRQRVAEMGHGGWFHPSITIARKGFPNGVPGKDPIIQRGDMLHTDFGIVYVGYSTDTQHLAYVLQPGETDAPQGLKDGLKAANRLQDLTMQFAKVGGTGNEALAAARKQAIAESIVPSIYCHPIGYHGHGAGSPIGMTDYQQGVPVRGDYPLNAGSWHSIELNATHKVKEWGDQAVRFALEEDAFLNATGWEWVVSRQSQFHLIK